MKSSRITEGMISRARGALIGFAMGDALGAPVEFMTRAEIRAKYRILTEMVGGGWLRLKPGQVTDDTEMSLWLGRALLEQGAFSITSIADNFATWLKAGPADVGDTCRRGIRNYILHGKVESPPNEWDAGNGALMRMVPVALFTIGNDAFLEQCAHRQAHLTHNHPLSDAACSFYGRCLQLAILGASKSKLLRDSEVFTAQYHSFRFQPYPGLSSGYVVDTVQTVFHHFFTTRSLEEAVIATVNQGGDADTTGALAGGLAGAYYGFEDIPRRWIRKLDPKVFNELNDMAVQLLHLSPLAVSS